MQCLKRATKSRTCKNIEKYLKRSYTQKSLQADGQTGHPNDELL